MQTGQANEADETGTAGHVNAVEYPLEMHVWWGWMDDMVVRKGQCESRYRSRIPF